MAICASAVKFCTPMSTQTVEEKNCSLPLRLKQAHNNKIPLPPRPEMKHVMFFVLSVAQQLKAFLILTGSFYRV